MSLAEAVVGLLAAVLLAPLVFLPLLLCLSRQGDQRNARRAFFAVMVLCYGMLLLSLLPIEIVTAIVNGPVRNEALPAEFKADFGSWRIWSAFCLGLLFLAAGAGLLWDRKWGYSLCRFCLLGFAVHAVLHFMVH